MKELFSKVARGSGEHFEKNKGPLLRSYEFRDCTMLPYPAVFALRPIFGTHINRKDDSKLRDEDLAQAEVEAVLDAPSKAELKKGIPSRNSTEMRRFDLDGFDQHENDPQNGHADLLEGLRNGTAHVIDRAEKARFIAHDFGITPTSEQLSRLVTALDAAFEFSEALYRMSKDKGYDFYKHASDWGDVTQLYYMGDDSMYLLT